jgi:hypothetical protein
MEYGLNSVGSKQGLALGRFGHGNEHSGFRNRRFVENCYLHKTGSDPESVACLCYEPVTAKCRPRTLKSAAADNFCFGRRPV